MKKVVSSLGDALEALRCLGIEPEGYRLRSSYDGRQRIKLQPPENPELESGGK